MFYLFPADLSLVEVRAAIARHNTALGTSVFIEADRGDHVIFNYVVSTPLSFPQPDGSNPAEDRFRAIIRECRGLIFSKGGDLLARRWHKFFNVNEKAFTQAHLIDWSQPHVILEKLDGSMITPFFSGGVMRFGTKMGLTDVAAPVEQFVAGSPGHRLLCEDCIGRGQTPIFEWCSRKQKIVVDYEEDALILTGIRDNFTGSYTGYERLQALGAAFNVPVVRALPGSVENIETFMAEARDLEGAEGYIIAFENGHRLKIKGQWYCMIHGTRDAINLEKDVLALILNDKVDDLIPFMSPEDRYRIERYTRALEREIATTAARLAFLVRIQHVVLQGDSKRFALDVAPHLPAQERALCFAIWNGRDPVTTVRDHVRKNVNTGPKVNIVRPLINGLHWDDYRDQRFSVDD